MTSLSAVLEQKRRDVLSDTKVCSKCKRRLPLSEFYADGRRIDGLRGNCKQCHSAYVSQTKNVEKLEKYSLGELRWRPIEHALEQLPIRLLARIWGVNNSVAGEIANNPWHVYPGDRDYAGQCFLTDERIAALRNYLETGVITSQKEVEK